MASKQEEMVHKVEALDNKIDEEIEIINKTFDDKMQVLNNQLEKEKKFPNKVK